MTNISTISPKGFVYSGLQASLFLSIWPEIQMSLTSLMCCISVFPINNTDNGSSTVQTAHKQILMIRLYLGFRQSIIHTNIQMETVHEFFTTINKNELSARLCKCSHSQGRYYWESLHIMVDFCRCYWQLRFIEILEIKEGLLCEHNVCFEHKQRSGAHSTWVTLFSQHAWGGRAGTVVQRGAVPRALSSYLSPVWTVQVMHN